MVDERTVSFINSLDPGNPQYLDELEKYAINKYNAYSSGYNKTRGNN